MDGFDSDYGTVDLALIVHKPSLRLPIVRSGDQVQLPIEGDIGSVYTVEASSDLTHWIPVASQPNTDRVLRFTDSAAVSAGQRFYRLIWER